MRQFVTQAIFHGRQVAKEQAFIDAQEKHLRQGLHLVSRDIAEVAAAGDAADHGDMRGAGAVEVGGERKQDAERDPHFQSEQTHAERGPESGDAVGPVMPPGLAHRLDVHHAQGSGDDAGCEHRQWHMGE